MTCSALRPCTHHRLDSRASTTLTHTAQAMCSEGIAAIWLACETSGEPQLKTVPSARTVSTNTPLSSSRGGATGHSAKQLTAMRLSSTNVLRAQEYTAGRRR